MKQNLKKYKLIVTADGFAEYAVNEIIKYLCQHPVEIYYNGDKVNLVNKLVFYYPSLKTLKIAEKCAKQWSNDVGNPPDFRIKIVI